LEDKDAPFRVRNFYSKEELYVLLDPSRIEQQTFLSRSVSHAHTHERREE